MSNAMTFHPPIERSNVLSKVRKTLAQHDRVLLSGPSGVGKSVIIDQVLATLDPHHVLRAYPTGTDIPFAGLAELLCEIQLTDLEGIPGTRADAIATLLRLNDRPVDQLDPIALALGVRDLVHSLSTHHSLWIVVDSVDDCDDATLKMITHLWKHVSGTQAKFLLAARESGFYRRLGVGVHHEVGVPMWDLAEIVEVLAPLQLPNRQIASIHRASGGRVDLALRIGGDVRPPGPDTAIAPSFGPSVESFAHDQIASLSPRVQHTLLYAALALDPTEALLQRAGRSNVHEELAEAARHGFIAVEVSGAITFHAESTTEALRSRASAATVKRAHRKLAGVATDRAAIIRHRALSVESPQPDLVAELEEAVTIARRRGDPTLAAELKIIAAEHLHPDDIAQSSELLSQAAELAASAGRSSLVVRAARSVLDRDGSPTDRLRAQLAIIDAAGQDLEQVGDIFAEASPEGADPVLGAELKLWHSWRAHITDGDLRVALRLAIEAEQLAATAGSPPTHMQTLTMVARLQRALGKPEFESNLQRAIDICPLPKDEDIPGSAAFLRARFALFDDDLVKARHGFTDLLRLAKQNGDMKALSEVLRSLTEVELRNGNCETARTYVDRAVSYLIDADMSMSPIWYVYALIEAMSGDYERSHTLAQLGLGAASEDQDIIFTSRNRFALGYLNLMKGDPASALVDLTETQRLENLMGVVDPTTLPWRGELAEAKVRTGDVTGAIELIAETRGIAQQFGCKNVEVRLNLPEASCELAQGNHDAAAELLRTAIDGFRTYGLRIELGRSQLGLAMVERRRRRRSAARAMLDAAEESFTLCRADGWLDHVNNERLMVDNTSSPSDQPGQLTVGETRVASLVSEGASNRQVATALNISVKTVETRLSRIYRKLGIQSRTQLANHNWDSEG